MKRLYQLAALSMMAGGYQGYAQELKPTLPKENTFASAQMLALNAPRPERLMVSAELADITVTGKVTDEKGDGLPGVSVVVKGVHAGRHYRW